MNTPQKPAAGIARPVTTLVKASKPPALNFSNAATVIMMPAITRTTMTPQAAGNSRTFICVSASLFFRSLSGPADGRP